MANDTATLRGKLATQLNDAAFATWPSAEMDDLINWSLATLPTYGIEKENDSSAAGAEITIVAGTYYYSVPTGVVNIYRIDIKDSGGTWACAIDDGGWELTGDVRAGSGKIRFPASVNDSWAGGKYVVHGYSTYDGSTNYIPDSLIPLVLAMSRAEAYRRLAGERARFETWLSANQGQNVTVNELLMMINEADSEAMRLAKLSRRWHRPVPGRI